MLIKLCWSSDHMRQLQHNVMNAFVCIDGGLTQRWEQYKLPSGMRMRADFREVTFLQTILPWLSFLFVAASFFLSLSSSPLLWAYLEASTHLAPDPVPSTMSPLSFCHYYGWLTDSQLWLSSLSWSHKSCLLCIRNRPLLYKRASPPGYCWHLQWASSCCTRLSHTLPDIMHPWTQGTKCR